MSAFLSAAAVGPHPLLDRPNEGSAAADAALEVKAFIGDMREALKAAGLKGEELETRMSAIEADLASLHQKAVRGGGASGPALHKSMGAQVVADEQLKQLASGKLTRALIEIKGLTSAPDSGGALAPPMQISNPVVLPRRVLRVRDLCGVERVDSGAVYFPKMVSRDLNPASVAQGQIKPESFLTFEGVTEEVGTIAHWIKVAKQLISDSPVLRSLIDVQLTWGLKNEEDRQLIAGTGTVVAPASGKELKGMLPQATAYASPVTLPTPVTALDTIAAAKTQIENNNYAPDAIVVHPNDALKMRVAKDSTGLYMLGPPQTDVRPQLYSLPVVVTTSIPAGQFLIGAFKEVTRIWDREEAVILVSLESGESFVRNEAIFLCEERLGFSVLDPLGLVKGALP